jgi:hypothetical protein
MFTQTCRQFLTTEKILSKLFLSFDTHSVKCSSSYDSTTKISIWVLNMVGKLNVKRPLGRTSHRWQYNITR